MTSGWHSPILDYVLVPCALALFVGYHAWLLAVVKARPTSTAIGVARINRKKWVFAVMQRERDAILAVQTLRNSIMACTLVASGSALAAVAVATFLSTADVSYTQEPLSSMVLGSISADALLLKVFCLFLVFIGSFVCQTQAIRFFGHVNFLVSIPPASRDPASLLTPAYVARQLSHADDFYTAGIRIAYLAIPLAAWLLGPVPCAVAAAAVVAAVWQGDFAKEFLMQMDGEEEGGAAAAGPG